MILRLSFIVPVYNVAKWLPRCIDSLLNQDIDNVEYEILLINDGSTDDSHIIIKEYEERYQNIIGFHKKNGGASSARNYGLQKARGDYIWFVDSDDTIKENCLKDLLGFAINNDLDYIDFPIYHKIEGEDLLIRNNINKPVRIINSIEFVKDFYFYFSPCCFISKRELWIDNSINFIEGIIGEDYDCCIIFIEHCKRISHYKINNGLYFYYIGREGSVTTEKSEDKYKKILDSFIIIIETLKNKYPNTKDKDSYGYWINHYWLKNIKVFLLSIFLNYNFLFNISKEEQREYLKIFKDKKVFLSFFSTTRFMCYVDIRIWFLSHILFKSSLLYFMFCKILVVFRFLSKKFLEN